MTVVDLPDSLQFVLVTVAFQGQKYAHQAYQNNNVKLQKKIDYKL